MNVDLLLSFVLASAVLAISPGPDNIYVLLQGLVHGKKAGLSTVCGLISGCVIHTSLVAFGVSAIIAAEPKLFWILKLVGAVYLLYLAYRVFKSSSEIHLNTESVPNKTNTELFTQGFIMNVLNPKVSIFFLAFFPGFLFNDSMPQMTQFYVLGGIFMTVSFVIFAMIALLAGSISTYILNYKPIGLILKWLQVIVFVAIAILILASGNL